MNLGVILILIMIVVIIISNFAHTYFKIKLISAVTLGIIAGYIMLNIIYPIGQLMYQRNSVVIFLYLIIEIFVPLYLLLYLIIRLIFDKRDIGCIKIGDMCVKQK